MSAPTSSTQAKQAEKEPVKGEKDSDELDVYDVVYRVCSPDAQGMVLGSALRPVLLRSKVESNVLRKIWNMIDTKKKGAVHRMQLNYILYAVALAQQGKPIDLSTVSDKCPPRPPVFEGLPTTVGATKAMAVKMKVARLQHMEKVLKLRERKVEAIEESKRAGLQYEDFTPQLLQDNSVKVNLPGVGFVGTLEAFTKSDVYEPMSSLMQRANAWIAANPSFQVMGIQSLFVPVAKSSEKLNFAAKDQTYVNPKGMSMLQIIRVFYFAAKPKPVDKPDEEQPPAEKASAE